MRWASEAFIRKVQSDNDYLMTQLGNWRLKTTQLLLGTLFGHLLQVKWFL